MMIDYQEITKSYIVGTRSLSFAKACETNNYALSFLRVFES